MSPNGDKFDAGLENLAAIQSLTPTIDWAPELKLLVNPVDGERPCLLYMSLIKSNDVLIISLLSGLIVPLLLYISNCIGSLFQMYTFYQMLLSYNLGYL